MTLRRYLTRLFAARALGALAALAALLQLLDLLDKASELLAGGAGLADVARHAALRLPTLLGHAVPVAVLVGAVLAFLRLAATSEMAALRAAGVGGWRVLGALAPACAAAAAFQLALLLAVAPRTERALVDWWAGRGAAAAAASGEAVALPRRLWLRNGEDIVAADAVSLDGSRLGGVLLVRRDAEGGVAARIEARGAEHGGAASDGWVLRDANVVRPGQARAEPAASLAWPDGPAPEEVRALARPTEAMPPDLLLAGLRGEGAASRGPAFYATRAQSAAASPAVPFLMALLALPAAFTVPRRSGWRRAAVGLALGLGYLATAGLLGALGEAGALPPVLAAWAPPLLFAAAGVMLLQRDEGW